MSIESSCNVLIGDGGPGLEPVAPAEPPAAWIGGKRHLAQRICKVLAATPHDAYAEPFVGMGGVFLRRAQRPRVEVINDVSGDVVTLFRVLQRHPEALLRELRWRPAMRAEWARLMAQPPELLTDIERAGRLLYVQSLAYGGKVKGRNFGVDPTQPHSFDIRRLEPRLKRIHDRLASVIIENLDWADFLARYDRAGTLFYLDPPYWGSEDDYGADIFPRTGFARMAAMLHALQGRFVLSINDVPEIRTLFAWADVLEVTTRYSIQGSSEEASELLIGKRVRLEVAAGQARLI